MCCLSAAPRSAAALRLRALLQPDEPVLLLGAAVVLAASAHPQLPDWLASGARFYALEEDLQAYGVLEAHEAITPVSYADWVRLTETYATQTLWR